MAFVQWKTEGSLSYHKKFWKKFGFHFLCPDPKNMPLDLSCFPVLILTQESKFHDIQFQTHDHH